MSTLVDLAISAHGGMGRWERLSTVSAHLRVGGALWALKGKEGLMGDANFEAELHRERASFWPFQSPDGRTAFTPDRVAIETTGGVVLDERHDRHSSFAGHVQDTPWDNLHAVYFGSYALWTYLTIPFLFTYPRVAHRND
jgi:hypothetical protein